MISKNSGLFLISLLALNLSPAMASEGTWTDPEKALAEDPDFSIQGEYAIDGLGVQVIARGEGNFEAWLLDGGLPGIGWKPENTRLMLKGRRDGEVTELAAEDGQTTASIRNKELRLLRAGEDPTTLPKIERASPTLGAEPPQGAVILFNGSSADAWEKGKVEDGLLAATNCITKESFKDYSFHLEFRTPYMPQARGQKRGNSGVYYGGRWETQILDSFGLGGAQNECGGIYSIAAPSLNMCLPPLVWQTYDVDFTAARFDADGKRSAWPRITVRLNGVLIHDDLELTKDFTPSAAISGPLTQAEGPIFLQNHNDPVFFKNIWLVPAE